MSEVSSPLNCGFPKFFDAELDLWGAQSFFHCRRWHGGSCHASKQCLRHWNIVSSLGLYFGCLYAAKWWVHCGRSQVLLCQTPGFRIKEMELNSVGGNMGIIQASEHVPQQRCFILNKRRGRCWRKLQIEVANQTTTRSLILKWPATGKKPKNWSSQSNVNSVWILRGGKLLAKMVGSSTPCRSHLWWCRSGPRWSLRSTWAGPIHDEAQQHLVKLSDLAHVFVMKTSLKQEAK